MTEIKVKIQNCNNIKNAEIVIKEDCLNIKYAMNGTGKSSIAKVIDSSIKKESLDPFKPFGTKDKTLVDISEIFDKAFVFDEDFIKNIVFKEKEVIPNSFDIFIKTDDYDLKLKNLNARLEALKTSIGENEDIQTMLSTFTEVLSKISLNNDSTIKQNPFFKALIPKENIHNIPKVLSKFEPFLKHKICNIDWIDWKTKGANFDSIAECPYCTEKLNDNYTAEKKVFKETYKKKNVENTKNMLGFLEKLEPYINKEKQTILYDCIKNSDDEEDIKLNISKFIEELDHLKNKLTKVIHFDSHTVTSEEISTLDKIVIGLKIELTVLDVFNSKKTKELVNIINQKINSLLSEINSLKTELGDLKGTIKASVKNSIEDINSFLMQAGISYKFSLEEVSQNDSIATLKYITNEKESIEVNNIKRHLSWGEKNAFALVLFMHYALSQKAKLIILDDPISSFDSHKKYAVINRLFDKNKKSLYNKTVLMLSHDFEPVIDFIINKKPTGGYVSATYLTNQNGLLSENEISRKDIKSSVALLKENAKNKPLNVIHRIVFLRKYIEHTNDDNNNSYNILSSWTHNKENPDKQIINEENEIDYIPLTTEKIDDGTRYIKDYIDNFNYHSMRSEFLKKEKILEFYTTETNNYLKLQLFRLYLEIDNARDKIKDKPFLKYVDEIYHIENDYIYSLDFLKFDLIPSHINNSCNDFLQKEISGHVKKRV
ncbi:MAG: AAA family ATPase [bacterium]|nr:AAA family ATPase [bacterium]